MMKLRSFVLTGFLFVSLPLTSSFAAVGISINVAPPALPVYEQPLCPAPGYIWTPGYWAWATGGYYWVPGVWVAPPRLGLLWTPAWWGWNNGVYVFHQGYWGPTVGFYGGINYGHGYWGNGYWGGRWVGNTFRYNTAVTRVNTTVIHNTYVDRTVVNKQVNRSHTSFNGPNGVKAKPTAEQKAAAQKAKRIPPTSQQLARQKAASKDRHWPPFERLDGNKHGAQNLHGNGRNLQGNKAKMQTGKIAGAGGAAGGSHMTSQRTGHPQMTARPAHSVVGRPQAAGQHQQGGGKHPQLGGVNRTRMSGPPQGGKKQQGKREKPKGQR